MSGIESLQSILIKTTLAFVGTNLDEVVVLIAFYAQAVADSNILSVWEISLGQFLAFTIIMVMSLFAGVVGSIALRKCQQHGDSGNMRECPNKSDYGTVEDLSDIEERSDDSLPTNPSSHAGSWASSQSFFNRNILMVATVLLSDGAEEIGVFSAIIGTSVSAAKLVSIFLLCYLLLSLQCLLAHGVVHLTNVQVLCRYSKNMFPFLLIGLGVYVLQDSVLVTAL
eukprot:scaffold1420_cov182-Ochromonas_danica.AAC.5